MERSGIRKNCSKCFGVLLRQSAKFLACSIYFLPGQHLLHEVSFDLLQNRTFLTLPRPLQPEIFVHLVCWQIYLLHLDMRLFRRPFRIAVHAMNLRRSTSNARLLALLSREKLLLSPSLAATEVMVVPAEIPPVSCAGRTYCAAHVLEARSRAG